MLSRLVALVALVFCFSVFAHPVIYDGGTVVSSYNMASYSDNQLLYTFSPRWAAGTNLWRFTRGDKNTEIGLARLNRLLWRYNGDDSQANIYLLSGLGVVDSEIERRRTDKIYMGGVEMDWETRTLYTALKVYQFSSPKVTDINMTQARIGFSPFESGFDQLQSWFMLQAMLMEKVEPKVIITPMLRFFYRNVLWEIGSSTRAEWMINVMVHY